MRDRDNGAPTERRNPTPSTPVVGGSAPCPRPVPRHCRKIVKALIAAIDELMTEYVSGRRAADWGVINKGLYDAERYLRKKP